jgi:NTE family protein
MAERPTVAVVLTGAAARGAFQAGALAEVLPALERRGETPSIWLGTSAGSITATIAAAALHEGADAVAARVLETWRGIDDDDVFRTLPRTLPRTALQYAAGFTVGLGPGVTSLLDTTPFQRTAAAVFPGDALAANVRSGVVSAVGAVATRMPAWADAGSASGRSVLFLDEHEISAYAGDPRRGLDVVRAPVQHQHVLASSAIPVAFPPVLVDRPASAAGWHLDGGVRLNAPLHPAIGLGAERIVLVSATSVTTGAPLEPAPTSPVPDVADASAQVITAVLGDRTTEDLLTLQRVNRMVVQAGDGTLTAAGGRAYRRVETMVVSPLPGEMARLAARVFAQRTRGLSGLRELDNRLIGRFLRGAGDAGGLHELLSYVFFDEQYMAAGIDLGRAHARLALQRGWQP